MDSASILQDTIETTDVQDSGAHNTVGITNTTDVQDSGVHNKPVITSCNSKPMHDDHLVKEESGGNHGRKKGTNAAIMDMMECIANTGDMLVKEQKASDDQKIALLETLTQFMGTMAKAILSKSNADC